MDFKRRPPLELDRLSDEELVAYAVAAREAGDLEGMRDALAVLINRHQKDVIARARKKLPDADYEDVAMQAIGDAILAKFEGHSPREFLGLVYRILGRRIADFYGKRERSPDTEILPDEHPPESEETPHRDVAISGDETSRVDARDVIEKVLARLSAEHVRTVELYVFAGYSAEETAIQVNDECPDINPKMSVDNVHKIASRFREDLRGDLGDAEEPGPPE